MSARSYLLTSMTALVALLGVEAPVEGQLHAGDSVRVIFPQGNDGSETREPFVGRILSVDGQSARLIAQGKPTCRAGESHGDPPICDPAPLIQQTVDLSAVVVQTRFEKSDVGMRMLTGGLLGGAALGAVGYAIGPSLGFGKVGGCREVTPTRFCTNLIGLTEAELAAEMERQDAAQLRSDQQRGAFFFGLVGATAAVIIAKKTSVGWADITPTLPTPQSDQWGLDVRVPVGGS